MKTNYVFDGWDSLVDMATRYRLHSLGKDSWWGAIFSAPVQGVPGTHTISCKMRNVIIPGVKRRGFGINKQLTFRSVVKERVY